MATSTFGRAENYMEKKAALGRLYGPLAVVFLASLSLSGQVIALYYTLSSTAREWVVDLVVVQWVGYMVYGLALWALFTVALYLLSTAVGGRPLVGHLIRVVGWGMAPLVLSGLVWSAGKYVTYRAYSLPEPAYSDIEAQNAAFTEYTAQAAGDPLYVGATLLGCLCLIGTGYIWTAGLTTASAIDRRNAATVSAVTITVFVLTKLVAVV